MKRISIIIPTYNQEHIYSNLMKIFTYMANAEYTCDMYIIDDGSRQSTKDSIRNFRYKMHNNFDSIKVSVVLLNHNFGKGFAIKTGIKQERGFNEYIIFMDSDLQIDISEIKQFLNVMELYNADAVIGNKRHNYSNVKYTIPRWIVSNVYNLIVQFLFGLRLRDTQCGFKLFRADKLKAVIDKVTINRYAFDLELLIAMIDNNMRIVDAPVYVSSQMGAGSVSFKNIVQTGWDTLRVWRKRRKGHYGTGRD